MLFRFRTHATRYEILFIFFSYFTESIDCSDVTLIVRKGDYEMPLKISKSETGKPKTQEGNQFVGGI